MPNKPIFTTEVACVCARVRGAWGVCCAGPGERPCPAPKVATRKLTACAVLGGHPVLARACRARPDIPLGRSTSGGVRVGACVGRALMWRTAPWWRSRRKSTLLLDESNSGVPMATRSGVAGAIRNPRRPSLAVAGRTGVLYNLVPIGSSGSPKHAQQALSEWLMLASLYEVPRTL